MITIIKGSCVTPTGQRSVEALTRAGWKFTFGIHYPVVLVHHKQVVIVDDKEKLLVTTTDDQRFQDSCLMEKAANCESDIEDAA